MGRKIYKEIEVRNIKNYYTEKQLKELLSHFIVIHDSAEKSNMHVLEYFDKKNIRHKERKLKTGDYNFMIESCPEMGFPIDTYFTDELCIERKSGLDEIAGNIKAHDERFFKELNRMINIQNCYLLVEDCRLDDIIEHNYQSEYNELAYLRRLLGVQRVSNFYMNFVKKENMGQMIYEICYGVLMSQIMKGGV